ncbi:MAG: hypothetical protein ACPGUZ_00580 [Holosporaceae bacterium]
MSCRIDDLFICGPQQHSACCAPPETRELRVQKLELTPPDENLGYCSKITFLPVDAEAYTGKQLGVDVVCETPPQTYAGREIPTAEKKLVISSTLLNGGEQQHWTPGPWCTPKKGFHYAFHLPTHGQPITVLDDDGYLTRGLLEKLQTKDSDNTPVNTLQGMTAQQLIEPLKTFFDYQCQKSDPSRFSNRLDFSERHSMYYQPLQKGENGWQTVRINPANHNFTLLPNDIFWMLRAKEQQTDYNAIQDKVSTFCSVMNHKEAAPVSIEGGTTFKVTLSDSIRQANTQPDLTASQEVNLTLPLDGTTPLLREQTLPPNGIKIKTTTQEIGETKTEHWPITSRLTNMAGQAVTPYDATPHEGYSNLLLTLSQPDGEDLLTVGPVYYQYSGSTSSSRTNWLKLDIGCSDALTFLSKEAEKALKQHASGLQSVLESQK